MVFGMTTAIEVTVSRNVNGIPTPSLVKKDGKYFRVQEVKRMQFDSGRQRIPREKYLVNINGYDKYLIKEGNRWYILNESEDERIFSHPASTPAEAIAI